MSNEFMDEVALNESASDVFSRAEQRSTRALRHFLTLRFFRPALEIARRPSQNASVFFYRRLNRVGNTNSIIKFKSLSYTGNVSPDRIRPLGCDSVMCGSCGRCAAAILTSL